MQIYFRIHSPTRLCSQGYILMGKTKAKMEPGMEMEAGKKTNLRPLEGCEEKSADLSSCRVNLLIHLIPHHHKTLHVAFKTSGVCN